MEPRAFRELGMTYHVTDRTHAIIQSFFARKRPTEVAANTFVIVFY